jgi:hypothetical protein
MPSVVVGQRITGSLLAAGKDKKGVWSVSGPATGYGVPLVLSGLQYRSIVCLLIVLALAFSSAQVLAEDLLTERNGNSRAGASNNPGLNRTSFGQQWMKLGTLAVDGFVYAQPL